MAIAVEDKFIGALQLCSLSSGASSRRVEVEVIFHFWIFQDLHFGSWA